MKIVCIGHATYDTIVSLDNFPKENTKTRIENTIQCGGGPAATAAYLLAKWGSDVSFLGIIGNDYYGSKIKEELQQVGVDITYIEKVKDYKTDSSYIIVNKKNNSRTILTSETKNIQMKKITPNIEPEIILMDGQEYDMSISMLENNLDAVSILDAGRVTNEVLDLSEKVTYLIASLEFASQVTNVNIDYNNMRTIRDLYLKMKNKFNNNIIITLEDRGCLYEIDGEIKIMSSLKVQALDTTGAGDIFHGAFAYGIANKLSYEQSIKLAIIASGLSVTCIGSRNSIFELDKIMEIYEQIK